MTECNGRLVPLLPLYPCATGAFQTCRGLIFPRALGSDECLKAAILNDLKTVDRVAAEIVLFLSSARTIHRRFNAAARTAQSESDARASSHAGRAAKHADQAAYDRAGYGAD